MKKQRLIVPFAVVMFTFIPVSLFADQPIFSIAAFSENINDSINFPENSNGTDLLLHDVRTLTGGELDTEWEDSIYYFQPNEYEITRSWQLGPTDHWSAVRFTPIADFILQGVRFCAWNEYDNNTDSAEVYIYSDNDGNPGEALNGGNPVFNDLLPEWAGDRPDDMDENWQEVNFDDLDIDYIEFVQGEDFWIMYGPAPAGELNANNGWWNLAGHTLSRPVRRSKWSTVRDGDEDDWSNMTYNYYIVAEGNLAHYFDLQVQSIFNNENCFFFQSGTEIQFTAIIINTGTIESPDAEVQFTVVDEDENVIFNETEDLGAMDAGDTAGVEAPHTWIPQETGYYYAHATLTGEGLEDDQNPGNNQFSLIQGILRPDGKYYYDDGEFETIVHLSDSVGCGMGFKPVDYPAQLDSIYLYLADGANNINLMVTNSDREILWDDSLNCHAGWNSLAIADENGSPFVINRDMFWIGYFNFGDQSYCDTDLPVAGRNPEMDAVTFRFIREDNNTYFSNDDTGNWAIRCLINTSEIPPNPFSLLHPPNSDTLNVMDASPVDFRWEEWIDPEQGEDFRYNLRITVTLPNDRIRFLSYSRLEEESLTINIPDSIMLEHWNDYLEISWRVIAVSGEDVIECENGFTFAIEPGTEIPENLVTEIPIEYSIVSIYPNPFNPDLNIEIGLPEQSDLRIGLFNIVGREVAIISDNKLTAGYKQFLFNASELPSGIYFIHASVPGKMDETRKIVLIK
ncbi:MAG: T9SS type A sorting domain-containing protein [Candidatus Electryonea clarkiae]|nr:T9SS type A sorting domain-containing protein [Candidatus Electryonea clarkiae]MDP8285479.1 T9SS type A sorting domain-containing protein [Candidatus Electryonea clarkiae]